MSKFNRARERFNSNRRQPMCLVCVMGWAALALAAIAYTVAQLWL